MHRWLRGGLVAVLVLGGGAAGAGDPLLPGIKGADDREIEGSTAYPWSAIGRFNKVAGASAGHCTGTLIGPRTVLTAAHCLWNSRTRTWSPPGSLHFLAGYHGGEYRGHSVATAILTGPGYAPHAGRRSDTANSQHDWALVTLAEPLGEAVGWLGVAPLDAETLATVNRLGTTFVQAGYSQDKPHTLTVNRQCALEGFLKGQALVVHHCDAVPGDSGSPLFAEADGRYRVAAIHVATSRGRTDTVGFAVPASSFLAAADPLIPDRDGRRPPK